MGSQRVGHNWATFTTATLCLHGKSTEHLYLIRWWNINTWGGSLTFALVVGSFLLQSGYICLLSLFSLVSLMNLIWCIHFFKNKLYFGMNHYLDNEFYKWLNCFNWSELPVSVLIWPWISLLSSWPMLKLNNWVNGWVGGWMGSHLSFF